ncbi:MAG TPA: ABC transporter permease [Solirubrobacteraceae bacterium]|jgi:ABC-2 type transport system permease protein|nr:ABC transporter permease [Solirubrobacteraceae bacterium]
MFFLVKYLVRLWRERQAASTAKAPRSERRTPSPRFASPGRSAAARGPLALLLHQTGFDIRTSLRNPRARFMTFIFPIVFLVVFNGVFGNGHTRIDGARVSLKVFYVPGILAMSIVVTAYAGLVISISSLRETGVLKRRRATPVPPAVLIAGQALATVAVAAVMSVILLVIAKVAYGVGLSAAAVAAVACTALLGTLTFACLGYAVSGLIGSPEAAQPIVQATMLPLWFISGVFIPVTNLSSGLKHVAAVFPVQPLANSLHLASIHSSFSAALSGTDLLVLAAWALGAGAFAAWRFSWLPSAAAA